MNFDLAHVQSSIQQLLCLLECAVVAEYPLALLFFNAPLQFVRQVTACDVTRTVSFQQA